MYQYAAMQTFEQRAHDLSDGTIGTEVWQDGSAVRYHASVNVKRSYLLPDRKGCCVWVSVAYTPTKQFFYVVRAFSAAEMRAGSVAALSL